MPRSKLEGPRGGVLVVGDGGGSVVASGADAGGGK
jgi:hypothetical protein